MRHYFLILFLYLFTSSLHAALPREVEDLLRQYQLSSNQLSVVIKEPGSRLPLLTHQADKPLNPASVMKVVTTFAALDMLGPDYRWKTEFYLRGKLKKNTLQGDLVIKGYGDPYLIEETLLPALRKLRQLGIHKINGHIILDSSYFNPGEHDPAAFDNKPFRVYNASPSALMSHFQSTRFRITPNLSLKRIDIHAYPESSNLHIKNELRWVNGKCQGAHRWPRMWFKTQKEHTTARFKGSYSPSCGQHDLHRSVLSPNSLFYASFASIWRYLGGKPGYGFKSGQLKESDKLIYTHKSWTLAEIIRLINKHSNNVMTRQLLLTLAAEQSKPPATLKQGRTVIKQWLKSNDIPANGFYLDNGSGLSRTARLSANTMTAILERAWQSPWMPEMLSSLAILGRDGTAKKRFRDGSLHGQMHIKTGILDHVRSMTGIFHGNNGKRYLITTLQNEDYVHQLKGTRIQDALLRWLSMRSK